MNTLADWGTALQQGWAEVGRGLVAYLPRLVGALLLVVVGWLVARLVRALVIRGAGALDRAVRRFSPRGAHEPAPGTAEAPTAGTRHVLGALAFWGTLVLFLAAATHVLALDAFSGWLGRAAEYLPSLVVGGLVVFLGFLLAGLARDLAEAATRSSLPAPQRRLVGGLARVAVITIAVIVGADQVGLHVSFLVTVLTLLLGAFLGGAALALGMAARDLFGNLLGARAARQSYQVGHVVAIGPHEGRILDIGGTAVVLDTPKGRLTIPAKVFHETPSLLVFEEGAPERGAPQDEATQEGAARDGATREGATDAERA